MLAFGKGQCLAIDFSRQLIDILEANLVEQECFGKKQKFFFVHFSPQTVSSDTIIMQKVSFVNS
jgi:hypothetical protein